MDQNQANESIVAAKGTITLGGQLYLVDPIKDQHFGTLQKWLRKRMANPLAAIAEDLKHLPKHLQEIAVKEAVALKAGGGMEMTRAFLESQLFEPEPCAFLVWILIRGNHPDVQHQDLVKKVEEVGAEFVLANLWDACGLGELEKNRNGRGG